MQWFPFFGRELILRQAEGIFEEFKLWES